MAAECNRYTPNSTRIQMETTLEEEMAMLGLIARGDRNPKGEVEREVGREVEREVEEEEEEEEDLEEDPKENPEEDPEVNSEGHFVIGNYTYNPRAYLSECHGSVRTFNNMVAIFPKLKRQDSRAKAKLLHQCHQATRMSLDNQVKRGPHP